MAFLYFIAIALFLLLCLLLCTVVLLQEGKGGGLGASFGGGEASDSLFGTSTAQVLRTFTGWLAIIFLTSCIFLSIWTNAIGRTQSQLPQVPTEQIEP